MVLPILMKNLNNCQTNLYYFSTNQNFTKNVGTKKTHSIKYKILLLSASFEPKVVADGFDGDNPERIHPTNPIFPTI